MSYDQFLNELRNLAQFWLNLDIRTTISNGPYYASGLIASVVLTNNDSH